MFDYLYTVAFADGSTISQTHEDVSSLNPAKSVFFDVLQKEKSVPATSITLSGKGLVITLDFATGSVSEDGIVIHKSEKRPSIRTPLRVIYFRRMHIHASGGELSAPQIQGYNIGWQTTTESGENVQEVFEVQ